MSWQVRLTSLDLQETSAEIDNPAYSHDSG